MDGCDAKKPTEASKESIYIYIYIYIIALSGFLGFIRFY